MDKFQVVDEKDLQVIEGGIEPISIIFGLKCYCIWRIWGWLQFGSDLAPSWALDNEQSQS